MNHYFIPNEKRLELLKLLNQDTHISRLTNNLQRTTRGASTVFFCPVKQKEGLPKCQGTIFLKDQVHLF